MNENDEFLDLEFSADTQMTVTLIFDYELNQTYDKLLLEFA